MKKLKLLLLFGCINSLSLMGSLYYGLGNGFTYFSDQRERDEDFGWGYSGHGDSSYQTTSSMLLTSVSSSSREKKDSLEQAIEEDNVPMFLKYVSGHRAKAMHLCIDAAAVKCLRHLLKGKSSKDCYPKGLTLAKIQRAGYLSRTCTNMKFHKMNRMLEPYEKRYREKAKRECTNSYYNNNN